jgi:hypothetical protein
MAVILNPPQADEESLSGWAEYFLLSIVERRGIRRGGRVPLWSHPPAPLHICGGGVKGDVGARRWRARL